MAIKMTLVLDDETAAGWNSAVREAQVANVKIDRIDNERAARNFRREEQLRKNRELSAQKQVQHAESTAAGIGKWVAGAAAALVTFESLKQVLAAIEQSAQEVADEQERLGESNSHVEGLKQSYDAVNLALKDVLRQSIELNESIPATGRLARGIAETWGNAKEAIGFVLSGKFKEELANDQLIRSGKLIVKEVDNQIALQKDLQHIQEMSTTELDKQEKLLRKHLQSSAWNQQEQMRLGQQLAAIGQRRLADMQKEKDAQSALVDEVSKWFEQQMNQLSKIADFKSQIEAKSDQQVESRRRREFDISKQQEREDARRLTFTERLAETQEDKDKAAFDAASRELDVIKDQEKQADKFVKLRNEQLDILKDSLKTEEDLKKNADRIKAIQEDIAYWYGKSNSLADDRKKTEREIEEIKRTAAVNREKERMSELKALQEKRRMEAEDAANRTRDAVLQQRLVQRAAGRISRGQIVNQIAADRQQRSGGDIRAIRNQVAAQLRHGRIGRNEIAQAQANILRQTVKSAADQGKLNQRQAKAMTKAVDQLAKQSQDITQVQQDFDALSRRLDALDGGRNGTIQRRRAQRRN